MEFLATHFWTILAFIGSFGAIGIAVVIFVFGVPAAMILVNISGAFQAFVKFLSTPLGQACAVLALVAMAFFLGDLHGTRVEKETWVASDLAKKLADQKRQTDIAQSTARDATERATVLAGEEATLKQKVADYEKSSRHDVCVIGDDRAARLRDIAGQVQRAPVPKSNPRRLFKTLGAGRGS